MPQPEFELASELTRRFPDAARNGRACWSVALQNGHSHFSRVSVEGGILVLTTGPIATQASAQDVLAMNASFPAASRMVCAAHGLQLRTEWALSPDAMISKLWETALYDFQFSLDVFGGAQVPQPATVPVYTFEKQDPAPHWNARANDDGTWSVPLPQGNAVLHASASLVQVQIIVQQECADEGRAAISEYLLRATSQIRFIKACASPESSVQWAAWLQASPAACGMDEALTSVALAYRECAPVVNALSEVRIARRFGEVSSTWRAGPTPIPTERR